MALARGERLSNHWYPRPGWSETSRYLTWHLLPDRSPALLDAVARYQLALEGLDGIDLVPRRWLHLTVQGVGFADQVGPGDVDAVVAATRRRLAGMPPVELTFGPAAVHQGGILLDGTPGAPVAALRTALREAIAEVRGAERVDGEDDEPVWPHLSLAYAHAAVPAAPLLDAVAGVPAGPVRARFACASLLELRREDRLYCWERLADVPLSRG